MTFEKWWEKYKSKGVDYDGMYGEQCVDLANSYAEECLGIKRCFYGGGIVYAYQIFGSKKDSIAKNFLKFRNAKDNFPKKGDVIIWGKERNGYAGHVAIVKSATKHTITVYEQNFDGKGKLRSPKKADGGIREYKYLGYKNVTGWLRFRKRVKANGGLRLREAPGGAVIKIIPNNTPVDIIGTSGNWYQVRVGEQYGYMSKDYLV